MRIGLIDVDAVHRDGRGKGFPNLALMRISAYHKARGDTVEWWWSDFIHYDIVYMSKVFSDAYSPDVPEPLNADKVIKGGTGYAIQLRGGRRPLINQGITTFLTILKRCFLTTASILSMTLPSA